MIQGSSMNRNESRTLAEILQSNCPPECRKQAEQQIISYFVEKVEAEIDDYMGRTGASGDSGLGRRILAAIREAK